MLKRNGEICQIEVPDYPGRLTATEKRAYTAAIALVDDQLRDLTEAGRALAGVEKQIPQWRGEVSAAPAAQTLDGKVEGVPGDQWHVLKTLVKTSRSELLFCSRALEEGREFAVFEKFDPNSAYVMARELEAHVECLRQPQTHKYYSPAVKEWERAVYERRITHDGNTWLRYCVNNVRMDKNALDEVRPSKKKSADHIDGIVSALLAFGQSLQQGEQRKFTKSPLLIV